MQNRQILECDGQAVRRAGWGAKGRPIAGAILMGLAWLAAGSGYIASRMMVSVRFPAFQIYVLERFEERWQSLVSGAMSMAAGLSFALMALGGGYIAAGFSFRELFLLGAALTALSAFMLLVVQAQTKRRVGRE